MTGQPEDSIDARRRESALEPVVYAAREQSASGGTSALATEAPRPGRPPKPGPMEWAADD